MASIRKTIKCSCGAYSNFDFNTDMNLEDLTIEGRCPSCGKDMHISIVSMGSGSSSSGSGNSSGGSGSSNSSNSFSGNDKLGEAIAEADKKDEYGVEEAEYDKVSGENVNKAINEIFGY